jgi:hypothetical protein
MARGLSTLFYLRALMNPFRYGGFALMLVSHKLLRWLPYLLAPLSVAALGFLAMQNAIAAVALGTIGAIAVVGMVGLLNSRLARLTPVGIAGFIVAVFAAGFLAWRDALRGAQVVTWDPTPRGATVSEQHARA